MIKLATTNDLDLVPFFYPMQAGWVIPSAGNFELVAGTFAEGVERLLAGKVDVALVGPADYAQNQDTLQVLPYPVLASDIASDSIFLVSHRRLDQYDKPKISLARGNSTGEALLRLLSRPYYAFEPEFVARSSEVEALSTLAGNEIDMGILSGEVGMRAAGPATAKGYIVEDLTKAWWLLTGQALPTGIFAVRKAWLKKEPNAEIEIRNLMRLLRECLLKTREQMDTVTANEENRTGLPADGLAKHYSNQRYEPNASHLNALLEFFRRGATLKYLPPVKEIEFFPALGSLPAAPAGPARKTQYEKPAEGKGDNEKKKARERAEAKGLQVIRGGKDPQGMDEPEDKKEK